jgi:hypothetical protein
LDFKIPIRTLFSVGGVTKTAVRSEPVGAAFHDLVRDSIRAQKLEASAEAELYLAALLGGFVRVDPQRLTEPLGPALLEAVFAEPASRHGQLKQVADTTLFLTGIFIDHIESRLAATQYYFEIGRSAYLRLEELRSDGYILNDDTALPYRELGSRFEQFVRVLSRIADTKLFSSHDRLVNLYERWLQKGNERDQARLLSLGVLATACGGDGLH